VHTLENTIVKTLHQFNIPAHTTSNVGVWVNDVHKIASIGIAISSLVSILKVSSPFDFV
jgi:lipoate-protein ligase B